ncbi:hypothetical protein [Bacillus sp. FJAT-45350]|uniref:hypothetical protein n=1 Tax=Bacillus sp. FJAT-45350 TaxID=2011014 RepID=UPI000BB777C5|nr:hypothetical protein [Bacillus sp. FJAT-45350]
MQKRKTDKLLKGIIGTSFAIASLTACSTSTQHMPPEQTYTGGQASPSNTPPSPDEADCDTWKWDEEGEVYQCVQEGSENYGNYYSGGSWFPTIAAFMAGRALGSSSNNNNAIRNQSPSQQQASPNTNSNTNQQVNQSNTNRSTNTNQVSNSRSGMGSGGSFGG